MRTLIDLLTYLRATLRDQAIRIGLWPNRFEWSIGLAKLSAFDSVELVAEVGRSMNRSLSKCDLGNRFRFVADPFLVMNTARPYVFFEAMGKWPPRGVIGVAVLRCGEWYFEGVAIREKGLHLSYPCVFRYQGTYWMVPETHEAREIRLYRCNSFPMEWSLHSVILRGRPYADTNVFRVGSRWWMFTYVDGEMWIYHSTSPLQVWTAHPSNGTSGRPRGRPGGTVGWIGDELVRWVQIGHPRYGSAVEARHIRRLNIHEYIETSIPNSRLEASGAGWNGSGMHHVSWSSDGEGGWLAVDGRALTA